MDQNMAFYDSIAPTKLVDLPEMATLCEQIPIENFVHEEGLRELTSFHHTEAEFKHSSSKIASKPNFVRTINCDLTRISFMFPATHNHKLIIECWIHLHLVCVCVCVSFLQVAETPKTKTSQRKSTCTTPLLSSSSSSSNLQELCSSSSIDCRLEHNSHQKRCTTYEHSAPRRASARGKLCLFLLPPSSSPHSLPLLHLPNPVSGESKSPPLKEVVFCYNNLSTHPQLPLRLLLRLLSSVFAAAPARASLLCEREREKKRALRRALQCVVWCV